jgi:molecular chaperone GrpE
MQDHEKIEPTVDPLLDVQPDAANDERATDATSALQEALRKAEAAARENQEAWLRAKADAENIRKRSQTDIANAHNYALEGFTTELLGVRDSLEAALVAHNATPEALRSGVELTLKLLTAAFEKFGIREVNPVGEKFDPHRHQGISVVESDADAGTVVDVLQKGYVLNDRVVRPALVTVAKPKASA